MSEPEVIKEIEDEAKRLRSDAERDEALARELRENAEEEREDADALIKKIEELQRNVTIIINTVDFDEPKGRISYDRVVELAYPDFAGFANATYSIIYERGPRANPEGVLSKGGSVEIADEMRFRVKRTGES